MMYSFSSCAQETKQHQLISQEEFAKILTKEDPDFVTKVSTRFDKNKPLYIYCAVGGRSNKAAKKLISVGFESVPRQLSRFFIFKLKF